MNEKKVKKIIEKMLEPILQEISMIQNDISTLQKDIFSIQNKNCYKGHSFDIDESSESTKSAESADEDSNSNETIEAIVDNTDNVKKHNETNNAIILQNKLEILQPIIKESYSKSIKKNVFFKKFPITQIHNSNGDIIIKFDDAFISYDIDKQFNQLIIINITHNTNNRGNFVFIDDVFKLKLLLKKCIENCCDESVLHKDDYEHLKKESINLFDFSDKIVIYLSSSSNTLHYII